MDHEERQLYELAKRISTGCKIIAKDQIAKDYLLETKYYDTIYITSDSGFECIVIGDTIHKHGRGYMYLYRKNTSRHNSFPGAKKIAALLQKVLHQERLEEGEGKAGYYDWPQYGGMEKQLEYFADVVRHMAFL